MAINEKNVKQGESALFYCRVKIDNMKMSSLSDSMISRHADCVELLEVRFEKLMTSRDYNDSIATGSLFNGYGS